MKIVVVSDSHGRNDILNLIREKHPEARLFIHCGDLEDDPMNYPGYIIVRGNNDYFCRFEDQRIIPIGKHRIFVTHSHRFSYFSRCEQLANRAKELDCDIVCFGHTHVAYFDQVDGVVLLNPGSLSHSRDGKPCSYAVLDIDENHVSVDFKFEPEW